MKTPREILLEVCPQIQKNAKQWDAYTGYNKELEKIVIEAMERYTEQKLNKHSVMQAEASASAEVATVGNSAAGKGVSDGKCPHPRENRAYIGDGYLRCNVCGEEFT